MFSYSGNPKLGGDVEKVRFLIGDTNSKDPLLQDEEIEYLIETEGSVNKAAIAAAEAIAAQSAKLVNETAGKTSKSYSDRAKAFIELAKRLRRRLALSAAPYSGGLDKGPAFTRDMMKNV
jgi:hypothetical protein